MIGVWTESGRTNGTDDEERRVSAQSVIVTMGGLVSEIGVLRRRDKRPPAKSPTDQRVRRNGQCQAESFIDAYRCTVGHAQA